LPRRKRIIRKEKPADQRFGSPLVSQFINGLMGRGKKSTAEMIFYDAIDSVEQKTGQNGLEVFQKALNNIKPMLEVRSRRVGGANYQVPVEVRPARRVALAIRWMISYARSRPEHTMAGKLASEILAAARNEGAAVKKREDTHKMAEANKAFAHFRW
jgi:small subunit ribosomal protein S7